MESRQRDARNTTIFGRALILAQRVARTQAAAGYNPAAAANDWTRAAWCGLASRKGIRLAPRVLGRAAGAAEGRVIVGLGLDIAEVDRVRAAIERHGHAFLRRLFTRDEIAYCERHRNRYERYAGRFAAKEAAMKALGTGWRRGVKWLDIEVKRSSGGKPSLELRGVAGEFALRLGVRHISLTITHSGNTAIAQVIFES